MSAVVVRNLAVCSGSSRYPIHYMWNTTLAPLTVLTMNFTLNADEGLHFINIHLFVPAVVPTDLLL